MADKEFYSGSDAYRQINALIEKSNRVLIISPYIDRYYAEFLAKHLNKRMYIISSSPSKEARHALAGGRFWLGIAAWLAGIFTTVAAAAYLLDFKMLLLFSSAFAVFAAAFAAIAKLRSRIRLLVPSRFIHAKLYIGDGIAISGSANLTYAGTHRNIEHIEIVRDPEHLKLLERQFWSMWNGR
jgi:hypothetical protein